MIIADDEGGWWAFATNGNGANIQTLRSTDLVTWEQMPDALPGAARLDRRAATSGRPRWPAASTAGG